MFIKEWIELTLCDFIDDVINIIRKQVGGEFLSDESKNKIEKIIYKYSEEIFFAQRENNKENLKGQEI